ncbi:MAG: type II toxin-antitoxin system VapC family toxin [Pseudomonadota bacterium]
MRVLLDTHVLLWALGNDPRLKAQHRDLLSSEAHDVFVSAATLWEIAIKRALGKLTAPEDLQDVLLAAGCRPLPITWAHAEAAGALPPKHADPFDRLLVAQARVESLTLATADASIVAYDVETV